MNTLEDGVTLGTVGKGMVFLEPKRGLKFFDKFVFKLFTLVRM